jgi:hypothetical protein
MLVLTRTIAIYRDGLTSVLGVESAYVTTSLQLQMRPH